MGNLAGKTIYQSYKSLITVGTSGTSGINGTNQPLTDGEGNELPIEVSSTEVHITSTTLDAVSYSVDGYGVVIDDEGNWAGPTAGLSGTSGTSGTSGAAGFSGTSGTSGTSGVAGAPGTSGSSGTSGTRGTSGTSGTSGAAGAPGTPGTNGSSGTSGSSGTRGTSGTSGLTGTSGSSGTSGATGTSGSSGTSGINGSSGTSGINGTSGTSGQGFTYEGNWDSITTYQPYDVVTYNVDAWITPTVSLNEIPGVAGGWYLFVQGGTNGTSGTSGLSGSIYYGTSSSPLTIGNGLQSFDVETGLAYSANQDVTINYAPDPTNYHMHGVIQSYDSGTGAIVVDVTKHTGSGTFTDWIINLDGAVGASGTSGTSGTSGSNGNVGPSGSSGTSGTSGIAGTSGSSGTSGTQGIPGDPGSPGSSGTSGTSGINGSSGTSGAQGDPGSPGSSGTSGTSGISGSSGTSGIGSSGTSGTSGAGGAGAGLNGALVATTTGGDTIPFGAISNRVLAANTGNLTLTSGDAGTVYFVPFMPQVSFTLAKINMLVTTAVASSTIFLGIYDKGSDGGPRNLLQTSTGISSATTGLKTYTISGGQALTAGTLYYLAVMPVGNATSLSVSGIIATACMQLGTMSTTTWTYGNHYVLTGTRTTLPSFAGGEVLSNAGTIPYFVLEN